MRGHIRRRGSQSWELKYDAPNDKGGRRTIYRSFKGTRREAQAELARLLARVIDGGHVDPSKLTVAEHLRGRLAHWRATGVISPKTAERYQQLITGQRPPKIGAEELQILTPEQVAELPAQLDGHPLAPAALTALFTGMRRGELLGLRWDNVALEEEVIHVRESLEETQDGLRFKPPKSKAGIRDIKLPAIVVDVLQAHRKQLLERRLQLGLGKLAGKDLVFPAWDGSPQSPNAFGMAWSRLMRELGIAVSFHGLRHTHASQLIDAGVDVMTIARRLGHASPAITLQVYAHLFRKDDGKAAAAINAALERKTR